MIHRVGDPGANNNNYLTPLDKILGGDRVRFRQMSPYKNNSMISSHQGGIVLSNHLAHPEVLVVG